MKKALVMGAGGFIGSNLVKRLKDKNYFVVGADIKKCEFEESKADLYLLLDLRDIKSVNILHRAYEYDEVYQLAADMGGAGYIFTGEHDADVMHNSAQINLNVCEVFKNSGSKIFYSSSACIYPEYNQKDPLNPLCSESSAYPAMPDSEYGWEKIFSERMYASYARNYELDIRIARFHNIFGENGTYEGGREKAPAAICRKVIEATDGSSIDIWGDGNQTRSFLYIEDCLDGIEALMNSNYNSPVNIGSEEMISIANLAKMVIEISGKEISINFDTTKPQGVRGRNSDNKLCLEKTGWEPKYPLKYGIEKLYKWIADDMLSLEGVFWID